MKIFGVREREIWNIFGASKEVNLPSSLSLYCKEQQRMGHDWILGNFWTRRGPDGKGMVFISMQVWVTKDASVVAVDKTRGAVEKGCQEEDGWPFGEGRPH